MEGSQHRAAVAPLRAVWGEEQSIICLAEGLARLHVAMAVMLSTASTSENTQGGAALALVAHRGDVLALAPAHRLVGMHHQRSVRQRGGGRIPACDAACGYWTRSGVRGCRRNSSVVIFGKTVPTAPTVSACGPRDASSLWRATKPTFCANTVAGCALCSGVALSLLKLAF